jgi:hypothetical protein
MLGAATMMPALYYPIATAYLTTLQMNQGQMQQPKDFITHYMSKNISGHQQGVPRGGETGLIPHIKKKFRTLPAIEDNPGEQPGVARPTIK